MCGFIQQRLDRLHNKTQLFPTASPWLKQGTNSDRGRGFISCMAQWEEPETDDTFISLINFFRNKKDMIPNLPLSDLHIKTFRMVIIVPFSQSEMSQQVLN